jgi:hypothetical protein
MWSPPPSCAARPSPWSAPPEPARPSPSCGWPTWPRAPAARAPTPPLVPALITAYRLGNPQARIGCWPDMAMDMWRGTPAQVQSRLLAVEQFTEPFYQRVASAGLRLALTAPDMPPVEGSDELLRRLDVDELAVLSEGRPLQLKDVEAIADHLPGARLRCADFFAALAGAFDRGHWSYEDVDLAVLTVPTLLSKAEADAAMRVVLEDYGHYATGRKPRRARTRCSCWMTSPPWPQAWTRPSTWPSACVTSASRSWSPPRVSRASAITARHRGCWPAAPVESSCSSARTRSGCWPWPARCGSWSTTGSWTSTAPGGLAKARMGQRPRIDPGQVRQAQPGEAWVIQAGHSLHLRVLPPPAVAPEPAEPAAALPLADDTIPLPTVEEPAPVGIAATVALAGQMVRRAGQQVGRRRERGGRLPIPVQKDRLDDQTDDQGPSDRNRMPGEQGLRGLTLCAGFATLGA